MAWRHEHEEDCKQLLGDPFVEVHRYLDALAAEFPVEKFDAYHRQFRHIKAGVEYCREQWGEEAAKAAVIHIFRDDFGFAPTIEEVESHPFLQVKE